MRGLLLTGLTGLALALGACDSSGDTVPLVDETGFLKGDNVRYTAGTTLTGTRVAVSIIGLPGTVTEPGGELTVSAPALTSPQVVAVRADGGFVTSVAAGLDDTLQLRYTLDTREDTLDLPLSDALDGRPAPTVTGSGSSGGQLSAFAGSDGNVSVDLGQLDVRTTDHVVFNESNGAARLATTAQQSVSLPGQSGDRICVFAVDAASASPSLCTTAL